MKTNKRNTRIFIRRRNINKYQTSDHCREIKENSLGLKSISQGVPSKDNLLEIIALQREKLALMEKKVLHREELEPSSGSLGQTPINAVPDFNASDSKIQNCLPTVGKPQGSCLHDSGIKLGSPISYVIPTICSHCLKEHHPKKKNFKSKNLESKKKERVIDFKTLESESLNSSKRFAPIFNNREDRIGGLRVAKSHKLEQMAKIDPEFLKNCKSSVESDIGKETELKRVRGRSSRVSFEIDENNDTPNFPSNTNQFKSNQTTIQNAPVAFTFTRDDSIPKANSSSLLFDKKNKPDSEGLFDSKPSLFTSSVCTEKLNDKIPEGGNETKSIFGNTGDKSKTLFDSEVFKSQNTKKDSSSNDLLESKNVKPTAFLFENNSNLNSGDKVLNKNLNPIIKKDADQLNQSSLDKEGKKNETEKSSDISKKDVTEKQDLSLDNTNSKTPNSNFLLNFNKQNSTPTTVPGSSNSIFGTSLFSAKNSELKQSDDTKDQKSIDSKDSVKGIFSQDVSKSTKDLKPSESKEIACSNIFTLKKGSFYEEGDEQVPAKPNVIPVCSPSIQETPSPTKNNPFKIQAKSQNLLSQNIEKNQSNIFNSNPDGSARSISHFGESANSKLNSSGDSLARSEMGSIKTPNESALLQNSNNQWPYNTSSTPSFNQSSYNTSPNNIFSSDNGAGLSTNTSNLFSGNISGISNTSGVKETNISQTESLFASFGNNALNNSGINSSNISNNPPSLFGNNLNPGLNNIQSSNKPMESSIFLTNSMTQNPTSIFTNQGMGAQSISNSNNNPFMTTISQSNPNESKGLFTNSGTGNLFSGFNNIGTLPGLKEKEQTLTQPLMTSQPSVNQSGVASKSLFGFLNTSPSVIHSTVLNNQTQPQNNAFQK